VLDRESTFADPEIVKMLKSRFIPVAIDQAYQRRQKDAEGEFYRKIAGQSPRSNFNSTTQGFYVATASGKLMLYNNNRDPAKVRRLMQRQLDEFQSNGFAKLAVAEIKPGKVDPRYNPRLPAGGLVVRVRAKILSGYKPTTDRWRRIFQTALSRDNLWISDSERQALVRGEIPASLQKRIARFHLVDNTRGEPPMWQEREIRTIEMKLDNGRLTGNVRLVTSDESRGYKAELKGFITVKEGKVVRFDVVALGKFWGEGRYTRGAPEGKFPLAVSFSLADGSDVADAIPPQGSRGWLGGYLR
jgi:hypothetical protein